MPVRTNASSSDAQAAGPYVICGIDITENPVSVSRNARLEALLTGEYNPFSEGFDSELQFLVYSDRRCRLPPSRCFYTAIWNVAAYGVSHGLNPSSAARVLRELFVRNGPEQSVQYLSDFLVPEGLASASRPSDFPIPVPRDVATHPAVTDDVLRALAEEGILEDDARRAVSILIMNGTMKASQLRPDGPLFTYGDDRRHIVSRILNCISVSREPQVPLNDDILNL